MRFDLKLTNQFLNSDLAPSTFPAPPAAQIVAFPFATDPAGFLGLKVKASTDWNGTGAPGSGAIYNFFNDQICVDLTPPSDCYRWEAFGAELKAGNNTSAHRSASTLTLQSRALRYISSSQRTSENGQYRPVRVG